MVAMPQRASMLFSSTASLFGAPGQGNYAAANAALEAFAASQSLSGLAITAVQWGAWAAGVSISPFPASLCGTAALTGLGLQCIAQMTIKYTLHHLFDIA